MGEIAIRAHEHRGKASEHPCIDAACQGNNGHGIGNDGGVGGKLQPDPAAILEEAVERRPRSVLQHEFHVGKTLPAHAFTDAPNPWSGANSGSG